MTEPIATLVILGLAAILLCAEVLPIAVVSMIIIVVLVLGGILSPAEAFAGFSNPIVVLLAATFVIGGAVVQSGLARQATSSIIRLSGKRPSGVIGGTFIASASLSGVLSNTGTTGVLLPVVISLARSFSLSSTQMLLALAFSANLGGLLTLIGSTPNLLASAALAESGSGSLGFFELAKIGLPLAAIGCVFMVTAGRRLCRSSSKRNRVTKHRRALASDSSSYDLEPDGEPSRRKMWLTGAIVALVLAGMAASLLPLSVMALIGAIAVVVVGCISYRQAIQAIDWTTILLIAGMFSLAAALEKTGAAMLLTQKALDLLGPSALEDPRLAVGFFFGLTWALTQVMPNTASSALLIPIALGISTTLGRNPATLLVAVAVGASCALATPIATPPNTMVYGSGGLRFVDFLKVGFPLSCLCCGCSMLLIPAFWPFYAS